MAYVPSTTPRGLSHPAGPATPPHPNQAAYEAALRDLDRFARLQAQTAALEAGQMAEGL